jgi:hypothetical protein
VTDWKASKFADWALVALHPWDLIDWRREVRDEDNSEDGAPIGPMPRSDHRPASIASI